MIVLLVCLLSRYLLTLAFAGFVPISNYSSAFGGQKFNKDVISECDVVGVWPAHCDDYPIIIMRVLILSARSPPISSFFWDSLSFLVLTLIFPHNWNIGLFPLHPLVSLAPFLGGTSRNFISFLWVLLLALSRSSIRTGVLGYLLAGFFLNCLPVINALAVLAVSGVFGGVNSLALIGMLMGVNSVEISTMTWINSFDDLFPNVGVWWILFQQVVPEMKSFYKFLALSVVLFHVPGIFNWSKNPLEGESRDERAVIATWCISVLFQPLPCIQEYILVSTVLLATADKIEKQNDMSYLRIMTHIGLALLWLVLPLCWNWLENGQIGFTFALLIPAVNIVFLQLATAALIPDKQKK